MGFAGVLRTRFCFWPSWLRAELMRSANRLAFERAPTANRPPRAPRRQLVTRPKPARRERPPPELIVRFRHISRLTRLQCRTPSRNRYERGTESHFLAVDVQR